MYKINSFAYSVYIRVPIQSILWSTNHITLAMRIVDYLLSYGYFIIWKSQWISPRNRVNQNLPGTCSTVLHSKLCCRCQTSSHSPECNWLIHLCPIEWPACTWNSQHKDTRWDYSSVEETLWPKATNQLGSLTFNFI